MILFVVITVTAIAVFIPWRYFRLEKRECERYALYKLRDDIAWELATREQPERLISTYQIVNASIMTLHKFSFWSFLDFMTTRMANQLEQLYQARQNKAGLDDSTALQTPTFEPGSFEDRFGVLLSKAAKKNSFWLRLSMTPLGHRIIFAPLFAGMMMKFLKKHPELYRRLVPKLLAIKSYSSLGEVVRNSHNTQRRGFV